VCDVVVVVLLLKYRRPLIIIVNGPGHEVAEEKRNDETKQND